MLVFVTAIPGIIDSPELRKSREKVKHASSLNSIMSIDAEKSDVKPVNEFQSANDFQPIKITHDDVVHGSNSVYGSQSPFASGGIIFAISGQQSSSTPLMSAGLCCNNSRSMPTVTILSLSYSAPKNSLNATSLAAIPLTRGYAETIGHSIHSITATTHDGSCAALFARSLFNNFDSNWDSNNNYERYETKSIWSLRENIKFTCRRSFCSVAVILSLESTPAYHTINYNVCERK